MNPQAQSLQKCSGSCSAAEGKNEGNNKTLTCNSVNFAMKLRFLLMSICVGEWSSTSLSFCSWPGRKQQSSEPTTKQAES